MVPGQDSIDLNMDPDYGLLGEISRGTPPQEANTALRHQEVDGPGM